MKVEDVMRCNFSAWYKKFEDVTIRRFSGSQYSTAACRLDSVSGSEGVNDISIVLPIPPVFLDYLNADTIVLPEGSHQGAYSSAALNDSEDEEAVDWNSNEECKEIKMPDCKGFLEEMEAAIARLGGKVFPKLNWSSPQDASWVSFNSSLQCCNASDVCLLLKSSDFVTHDLTQPFIHCEDCELGSKDVVLKHELILRRWRDINTGHEFRCFVKQGKLIAISPRNHSKFFKHIMDTKQEIQEDIEEFFEETVNGDFIEDEGCYTFDVWRKKKNEVLLIDFNPCGPVTDSLLFDWEELDSYDMTKGLTFRCVESESGVQPNKLAQFGMPKDFVDLASGEDPFKLMDLMKLGKLQGQDDSSSDDDDDAVENETSAHNMMDR